MKKLRRIDFYIIIILFSMNFLGYFGAFWISFLDEKPQLLIFLLLFGQILNTPYFIFIGKIRDQWLKVKNEF